MSQLAVQYLALDAGGQEVRGTLSAATLDEAARGLREQGLFPVELDPRAPVRERPARASWRPLRTSDRILFCRQLALLLRTGHPLLATLQALEEQGSHTRLRELAGRLARELKSGRSLSDALEGESDLPALVGRLVRTAEETGQLEQAFARAAEHMERGAELRSQVVASLTYPFVVFLVASGVFWFLALNVVPKLARFLSNRGTALPWTTQTLIDVSSFFQSSGTSVGLGVAALTTFVLLWRRTPGGRLAQDRFLLRVPLVGSVLRAAAIAQLSRTLSLLLESGVLLLSALQITAKACSNHAIQAQLTAAREGVLRGESLAAGLRGSLLGPLVSRVVATGESAGALDATLIELARFSEIDLDRRLKTLARLVEPAILVVVGGMVGFVYLAFFQAVLQLSAR
ncbi:MAG: type II secretion system F family protein [Planctomycetes bacterium]|nr:type II secretion system F family protein [Planctomycetota bacterium]